MTEEELKKYLDNENVQYFLYQIFKGESDKDDGVVNLAGFNQSGPDPKNNHYSSSAFGSQQFTGSTRAEVLKKYGVDAWSKDIDEQQMATLALLATDGTLKDVSKGDYQSTITRGRWQAFTKDPTLLTSKKPKDWSSKYENLKSTAVYDPKKSWDKIPEKNKIGKIKLFNGDVYGPVMKELGLTDTINSNIDKTRLAEIKNLTAKQTYESNMSLSESKNIDFRDVSQQKLGKEGFSGFSDLASRMGNNDLTITSATRGKQIKNKKGDLVNKPLYREGSAHAKGNALDFGVKDGDGTAYMNFFFGPDATFQTQASDLNITAEGKQYLIDNNAELLDERGMHPGGDEHGDSPHFHLEFNSPEDGVTPEAWDDNNFQDKKPTTVGDKSVTKWGVNNAYYSNDYQQSTSYQSYNTEFENTSVDNSIDIKSDSTAFNFISGLAELPVRRTTNSDVDQITQYKNSITDLAELSTEEKLEIDEKIVEYSVKFNEEFASGERVDGFGDDPSHSHDYMKGLSEYLGISGEITTENASELGYRRAAANRAVEVAGNRAFGRKISGQVTDSYFIADESFTNVAENSMFNAKWFYSNSGIPELGTPPEALTAGVISNPKLHGFIQIDKGGNDQKKFKAGDEKNNIAANIKIDVGDESPGWLGFVAAENMTSYVTGESSGGELVTSQELEIEVENLELDQAITTSLVDDPEVVADTEDVAPIALTLETLTDEQSADYEGWLVDNPEGSFEEWSTLPAAKEVKTDATSTSTDSGDVDNEAYNAWLEANPGKTKEDWYAQQYSELRGGDTSGLSEESFLDKMGGLSSLIGLATGAMALGTALKDVDIPKDPKLGPAFQQRLEESKRLAQQGLTPSELAKAHNDLDSSYATGIENIVRGSAGNRAQFLAGLGGLDVARQSALVDIAVADAGMQRQNQEKYDKMMMVNEQYEASRESQHAQAKYKQEMANKSAAGALAGSALSMVNQNIGDRQLNRYHKMKTEKLMREMGFRNDSKGNTTEKPIGVDPVTGEKVQTSFEVPSPIVADDVQKTSLIKGFVANGEKVDALPYENGAANMPSIDVIGHKKTPEELAAEFGRTLPANQQITNSAIQGMQNVVGNMRNSSGLIDY